MDIKEQLRSLSLNPALPISGPISSICTDSRRVKPGSVFIALKGQITDGHKYLEDVCKRQAQVLVIEDERAIQAKAFKNFKDKICVVPSTRKILPLLLKTFYNSPSEKMFCIGVTGTNGKTTISYIISYLFSRLGWRTGVIGTIKNEFEGLEEKSQLTTPDAVELYSLLSRFYEKGAQSVVMEVSSIGLDQERVSGVDFNLGVFTNLSEDHLDYHKDMERYFRAKKKLFEQSSTSKKNFLAVLNLDCVYGMKLTRELQVPYVSYGEKAARFSWEILSSNLSGTYFNLFFDNKKIKIYLPVPGFYNVSNAVAALSCVHSAGFSLEEAAEFLKELPSIPGRMQRVEPSRNVFVDYAHTPDALRAVLSFLKKNKSHRLITLFGCGGGRDKEKRPMMIQVAEELSDQVILTSDNPRDENPADIVEDCLRGRKESTGKIKVELDREEAIKMAIGMAQVEDVVLVAGKGHEKEQIIAQKRRSFEDVEKCRFYLKKRGDF